MQVEFSLRRLASWTQENNYQLSASLLQWIIHSSRPGTKYTIHFYHLRYHHLLHNRHIQRYLPSLPWRHNECDGVSNHQPHCLLNCLFKYRSRQSSASLAFVRGIHWWPVNSPYKGPVTRKTFPFDDVIMSSTAVMLLHRKKYSLAKSMSA